MQVCGIGKELVMPPTPMGVILIEAHLIILKKPNQGKQRVECKLEAGKNKQSP